MLFFILSSRKWLTKKQQKKKKNWEVLSLLTSDMSSTAFLGVKLVERST